MDILELPFVKKVGIKKNEDNHSELQFNDTILNHIETIHAGAQYTLAETASGELLQIEFPELIGKVIPILRSSDIKYKNIAVKTIFAFAAISNDAKEKFYGQFLKKGRALLPVEVEVKDSDEKLTCVGTFNWFVQKIN